MRVILPRSEADPEPVVVLSEYRKRVLFRFHSETNPEPEALETLEVAGAERWIQNLFRPKLVDGSSLVVLRSGDLAVVAPSGSTRSLGASNGVLASNGSSFLRLGSDATTVLSMPEGAVLRRGPALPEELNYIDDEHVGGVKLWRTSDFAVVCEPKHAAVAWYVRGSTAAAITVKPRQDDPAAIDTLYLEVCDLAKRSNRHQIPIASQANDDDDLETPRRLAISPDEKLVVVGGRDIVSFDTKSKARRFLGAIHFEVGTATEMAFSADMTRVCVSTSNEVLGFALDPLRVEKRDETRVLVHAFEGDWCVTRTIPKDPEFHPALRAYDASQVIVSSSLGLFAVLEGKGGSSVTRDSAYRVRVFDDKTGATLSTAQIEIPSGENVENPLGLSLDEATRELFVKGTTMGIEGTWDLEKHRWKTPYTDQRHILSLRPHGARTAKLAERLGAVPSDEWALKGGRVIGSDGRILPEMADCQAVFDAPRGVTFLVACPNGLHVHRRSDLKRLATVIPIGDGEDAIALLTGGAIDVRGPEATRFLRCLTGEVIGPWANCAERFLVPGALERALGGDETWLEIR